MHDKKEVIGRGTFGLIFVARANGEKVVVRELLSEDDQECESVFSIWNI